MAPKVMIVDDEPEVVRLLEVILSRAGYAVAKAYSGKECLSLLARENPDLILLDIMMPGMSGIEVMEALRTIYNVMTIPPVILLTAKGGMEAMIEGLQAGAYKYLVKPTSREKLMEIVKAALEYSESKKRPLPDELDWV
jgi:two-component system sensor histidine kinase ChiS